MSCTCKTTPCCCKQVISKLGEKGKPGPLGPPGPANTTLGESGLITLNAAGTAATGGALSNPGASPVITVTTTKRSRLVHFNGQKDADLTVGSMGKDNLTNYDCIYFNDTPTVASNFLKSIVIADDDGNGWLGRITQINTNNYKITFAKAGTGLAVSIDWHAITG